MVREKILMNCEPFNSQDRANDLAKGERLKDKATPTLTGLAPAAPTVRAKKRRKEGES